MTWLALYKGLPATYRNATGRPSKRAPGPEYKAQGRTKFDIEQTFVMAKTKGVPNKHLHARTSFLFQAATYLTLQQAEAHGQACNEDAVEEHSLQPRTTGACLKQSSRAAINLGFHLRAVSHKGQTRLSTDLKRTMCKACNAILIPGQTSNYDFENPSSGGKKIWAELLHITCKFCGARKTIPLGAARRQRRKCAREKSSPNNSFDTKTAGTRTITTVNDQGVLEQSTYTS